MTFVLKRRAMTRGSPKLDQMNDDDVSRFETDHAGQGRG